MHETLKWSDMKKKMQEDHAPAERTAGMHFGLLAPTRGGKTTLLTKAIIPIYRRAEVPVLFMDTTSDPKLAGYGEPMPRFGKIKGITTVRTSSLSNEAKAKIHAALEKAYKQGDVAIIFDEVRHVCDPAYLGMGKSLESLWLFGGKRGITIGGATQAPRWVPSAFYDQSKIHYLFRVRDQRARKRIEEISGDTETLRIVVPNLEQYHFAYVDPDGDVMVSKMTVGSTKTPGERKPGFITPK